MVSLWVRNLDLLAQSLSQVCKHSAGQGCCISEIHWRGTQVQAHSCGCWQPSGPSWQLTQDISSSPCGPLRGAAHSMAAASPRVKERQKEPTKWKTLLLHPTLWSHIPSPLPCAVINRRKSPSPAYIWEEVFPQGHEEWGGESPWKKFRRLLPTGPNTMRLPSPRWSASAIIIAAAKSLQSCPTLCDPIDGSPPGSTIPGILQARTLEWVAISFSSAWKWEVKVKSLSSVQLFATPWTAAHQAPPSMGFSRQEDWSGVPLPSPAMIIEWVIVAQSCLTLCYNQ